MGEGRAVRGVEPHLKPPRQRLESIQLLRGVAALLVVIAHSIDFGLEADPGWDAAASPDLTNFGAFGVDLFFVISGFVMAFSVEGKNGPRDAGRFLALRWARVAPPYLLITAALVAFVIARGGGLPTLQSVLNTVLMVPIFDQGNYDLPPLSIGWTLSFEFTFYLLIAGLLAVRRGQHVGWVGAFIVGLVAIDQAIPDKPFLLAWVSNPIMLEFSLGICAYLIWRRVNVRQARPWLLALGGLSVAILAVQIITGYGGVSEAGYTLTGAGSLERVVRWGAPAAGVFLAALALREPASSATWRAGRALGDWSYSLYLIHIPVLMVTAFLARRLTVEVPGWVLAAAIMLAIAASFAYYRLVERPLTRAARIVVGSSPRSTWR